MSLAEEAFLTRGSHGARDLYAQAFMLERQAVESLIPLMELEPTRSVFLRSAASLAVQIGEYREAERLVAHALTGNPPPEIAAELRSLNEQINFSRHLSITGVTLSPREFQFSMAGDDVAPGITSGKAFVKRVQSLERLILRTGEREQRLPFRERGRPRRGIGQEMALYLSTPRASSFAVTVHVGVKTTQMALPIPGLAESVIGEVFECLDMVEHGDEKGIATKIPDPAYRRNFVALARELAPDDDGVTMVGLSIQADGEQRHVILTRRASDISVPAVIDLPDDGGVPVKIVGVLRRADAIKAENTISIVDEKQKVHEVMVPEGMLHDIVRPHWEDMVVVHGIQRGRTIILTDITELQE